MTDSDYDYSDDTPEDILERIATARILRKQDELEESQELLLALLEEYPDQPLVLFEVGGSYDVMGEEELAIPYYRKALCGRSGWETIVRSAWCAWVVRLRVSRSD